MDGKRETYRGVGFVVFGSFVFMLLSSSSSLRDVGSVMFSMFCCLVLKGDVIPTSLWLSSRSANEVQDRICTKVLCILHNPSTTFVHLNRFIQGPPYSAKKEKTKLGRARKVTFNVLSSSSFIFKWVCPYHHLPIFFHPCSTIPYTSRPYVYMHLATTRRHISHLYLSVLFDP